MKKIIIICGLALGVVTACRKDRTCTCSVNTTINATTTFSGVVYTINETKVTSDTRQVNKATKNEALSNDCASYETTGPITLNGTQTNTMGTSTYVYTGTQTAKVDCKLD